MRTLGSYYAETEDLNEMPQYNPIQHMLLIKSKEQESYQPKPVKAHHHQKTNHCVGSPKNYVHGPNATAHLSAETKKLGLQGPVVIVSTGTPKEAYAGSHVGEITEGRRIQLYGHDIWWDLHFHLGGIWRWTSHRCSERCIDYFWV